MSAPEVIPARRLRFHADGLLVDPITEQAALRPDAWVNGYDLLDIVIAALGVWPDLYRDEAEERAWLAGRGR